MIQLTRKGLILADAPNTLAALRAEFDRMSSVKLVGFIGADLLELIFSHLHPEEFQAKEHKKFQSELMIGDNRAVRILHLFLNDNAVRQFMQDVTGCEPLRCFFGRFYRLLPNSGHYGDWHNDLVRGRRVGISVNFSQQSYEGGCFEMRHAKSQELIRVLPNVTLGDAILFKIDEALEHRVTEVTGTHPKTAFAGWYHDTGDYGQIFHSDGAKPPSHD